MSLGVVMADVVRGHGEAYRRAHAAHLERVGSQVTSDIAKCRTAAFGGHIASYGECGLLCCAYNSCCNRHCPTFRGQACAA